LLPKEFILYYDHQAFRYINSQKRVEHRHNKWLKFVQEYTFVLKYCSRVDNKAVDALSRKLCTLQSLRLKVIEFECLMSILHVETLVSYLHL